MSGAVTGWLASLIGVALVAALGETILPEGTRRRTLRLVATAGVITLVLLPLRGGDLSSYAAALRTFPELDAWDADAAEEQQRLLNRMLIESECSAYILDKADALGVSLERAEVMLRWDTDGYWVPSQVRLVLPPGGGYSAALSDAITTDLGIAPEAQEWSVTDET